MALNTQVSGQLPTCNRKKVKPDYVYLYDTHQYMFGKDHPLMGSHFNDPVFGSNTQRVGKGESLMNT